MLDAGGMFPAVGAFADGTNGMIYLIEGDMEGVAFSAIAFIPVIGQVSTPAKYLDDGAELVFKYGDDAAEALWHSDDAFRFTMGYSDDPLGLLFKESEANGNLLHYGDGFEVVSNPKVVRDGAARAAEYSKNWGNASLNDVIKEYAPNSIPTTTSSGKTIYTNPETGIQIVHDTTGNYFRIEDTNKLGKRRYLGLDGKDMSNKVENGKQIGRSKEEYERATHFNNIY